MKCDKWWQSWPIIFYITFLSANIVESDFSIVLGLGADKAEQGPQTITNQHGPRVWNKHFLG